MYYVDPVPDNVMISIRNCCACVQRNNPVGKIRYLNVAGNLKRDISCDKQGAMRKLRDM